MTKNLLTSHPAFQACILVTLLLTLLLSACQPAMPQFTREPQPGLRPSRTPQSNATTASETPAQALQPTPTDGPKNTPQPETPEPTPVPSSPLGVDPADLSGTQVSFWHNVSGPSLGILHGLVDEFNASNEWGIQVKAEYQGTLDELYARVETLEAGDRPDILVAYLSQATPRPREASCPSSTRRSRTAFLLRRSSQRSPQRRPTATGTAAFPRASWRNTSVHVSP